ncbi:MAG: signal peptide peptidase SppA [Syntrophotaleaceae bacterium]
MKKKPFVMALLTFGAIFVFFFLLVLVLGRISSPSGSFTLGDKIGFVEVNGAILASEDIVEQLNAFREDDSIKGVVLRINSPGGGVSPSQEIYQEVKALAAAKPVVVSMASVAASGGYYIAVPAHRILANPGSITGSIGVIMEFTNLQELFQKIGLKSQVVKSGQYKDIGSPFRPMSEVDRQLLQNLIGDVHEQFVTAVAEGRRLEVQQVREIADGRIFTGRQAMESGLVDQLGGYQEAIRVTAELAGIEGEPKVVYPQRDKAALLEYFVQETTRLVRQSLKEDNVGLEFLWSAK